MPGHCVLVEPDERSCCEESDGQLVVLEAVADDALVEPTDGVEQGCRRAGVCSREPVEPRDHRLILHALVEVVPPKQIRLRRAGPCGDTTSANHDARRARVVSSSVLLQKTSSGDEVIIEKPHETAGSRSETHVAGGGQTPIGLPDNTDRNIPALGLDRLPRSVGGAIEDDDHVEIVAKFC